MKNGSTKVPVLLLLATIVLTLVPQLYFWNHIADDAYISFRYSQRLAEGQGLTFNPGEKVEGFSNPLWVLILAAAHSMGFSIPFAARVIGLSLSLLIIISLWYFVKKYWNNNSAPGAFIISVSILLLYPGFHAYATSGMEVPLFSFLIVLGTLLSISNTRKNLLLAAVLFGLAGICRPEASLYAILWFVATLKIKEKKYFYEFCRLLLALVPTIIYEIFRVAYYHEFIPNTAIAKYSGTFGTKFGLGYIFESSIAFGAPLILFLFLLDFRFTESLKKIIRAAIGPLAACVIFIVYTQGDWMPFARFIAPVAPIISLVVASVIIAFFEEKSHLFPLLKKKISLLLTVLSFMLLATIAWKQEVKEYWKSYQLNTIMRGYEQLAIGEWFQANFQKGTTIATPRLGGISYGAKDMIIWDFNGLTDKEVADYLRKTKFHTIMPEEPIVNRYPDIIAHPNPPDEGSYIHNKWFVAYLDSNYVLVKSFEQKNFGTVDVWLYKYSPNTKEFLNKLYPEGI